MGIQSEIQSLSPSAIIELFVLDTTNYVGGTVFYFHAGTNQLQGSVVWQGNSYYPMPIEAEGFDVTARGTLPRPKLRVANVGGLFSAEVSTFDDFVGSKVIRKRTFMRYLDAVNFTAGINIDADPNQHFADDIWYVDQKVSENRHMVEWELASAFDLQGVMLPNRQVIQNACAWRYRSAECGYMGSAYDKNDVASDMTNDYCAKRLSSCRVRFQNNIIPFGGFPGSVRYA